MLFVELNIYVYIYIYIPFEIPLYPGSRSPHDLQGRHSRPRHLQFSWKNPRTPPAGASQLRRVASFVLDLSTNF